ncbi:uncharacterized protein V1510DRAFT_418522 [Dipodascopsis tothii]|uniref:uncharacterized protein n=1 Tax=Dipodascopsis tothii TaxID=44089 RepID=UPI0034CF2664
MHTNSGLLPFSHNESRAPNVLNLSTTISHKKRDYPASESSDGSFSTDVDSDNDAGSFGGYGGGKRMLFSDADMYETMSTLPSSPPREDAARAFWGTSSFGTTVSATASSLFDAECDAPRRARTLSGRSSSYIVAEPTCAIDTIRQAIEEGRSDVDLDSLGIDEVPVDVGDLKDLVVAYAGTESVPLTPKIRLYLSNNQISRLPPQLFAVENLTALSLRNNHLKEIPPAILRLQNLENLSVGGNQLEYLPSQILGLKHLQVLTIHPNPFVALPQPHRRPRAAPHSETLYGSSSPMEAICLHVSTPVRHSHSFTPTLAELALRSVSMYRASNKEIDKWRLPSSLLQMVYHATTMAAYQNTCGQCGEFMVSAAADVYEWWEGVAGLKEVALKREFCSGSCLARWARIMGETLD